MCKVELRVHAFLVGLIFLLLRDTAFGNPCGRPPRFGGGVFVSAGRGLSMVHTDAIAAWLLAEVDMTCGGFGGLEVSASGDGDEAFPTGGHYAWPQGE